MAKQIQEILIDDVDGGEAHETVVFALDGSSYEIDLHEDKADALRKALAPFIVKARPVRLERSVRGRRGAGATSRALSREKSSEIRQWAKSNGLPVSERGRIAASVVERYEAAH
ncbi:MAG: Lsr2 family protein [Nonomuraea sp.]|nr:Lsr2 family protein [Nonomuraea sp.]NUP65668.1 Lsr2 family protein [Nonomuraea sp.]NUP82269.1 Lsr2 family protein [Nonomuraea sp.]NUS07032.1 Lsr2 family protein [Nonomuraea sp.]